MDSNSINRPTHSLKGGLAILIIAGIFFYSVFFLCSTNEERYDTNTIVEHILQQIKDDVDSYSEEYPDFDSEMLLQIWQDGVWNSDWDSVRKRWVVECIYQDDDSTYTFKWLTLDDGSIVDTELLISE